MEQATPIPVAELKGSKLTDAFKAKIQATLASKGIKVSKQAAWDIFKEIQHATVDFTIESSGQRLSLAGVGTYRIHKSKPAGSREGTFTYVPRFKFAPSEKINNYVYSVLDCFESEEKKAEFFASLKTLTPADESANVDGSTTSTPVVETPVVDANVEVEEDDFNFDED